MKQLKDCQILHRSIHERRNIYQSFKKEDLRAYSLVGSPDYMAPEVLSNQEKGYGLEVDYWSVGCMMFECLAGISFRLIHNHFSL